MKARSFGPILEVMAEPNNPSESAGTDPLSSLYRMSKTAGLGSSEYQAVNVAAVVALVIGLLSFAANFDAVLIIIPLVGIVASVVAIQQIVRSNGTQTGLPMAIIGLLLCLAMGGWAGTARYRETARTANDRATLTQIVADLSASVTAEQYDKAYELFSDNFHQNIPRQKFDELWKQFRQYAPIKNVSSNGLFAFEEDQATQIRLASSQIMIEFQKGGQVDRQPLVFSYRNGRWRIDNIPAYFAPPKNTAPGN